MLGCVVLGLKLLQVLLEKIREDAMRLLSKLPSLVLRVSGGVGRKNESNETHNKNKKERRTQWFRWVGAQ